MTVADYQQEMWKMRDAPEKVQLIERFSQTEWSRETDDPKEEEAFGAFRNYFYDVYEPLTAERWAEREFSVWALAGFGENSDKAEFEGQFLMVILDEEELTVGEYCRAYAGMNGGLRGILDEKTPEELMDEAQMQDYLREEIQKLSGRWSSESLQIRVDGWAYRPLINAPLEGQADETASREIEVREYPQGTEADYASLLELKTPDYQKMSLEDFNMRLLNWANGDYGQRWERIVTDMAWDDRAVSLTEEERAFVEITAWLSAIENSKMVQSVYSKMPEEDPVLGEELPERSAEESGRAAWCRMYYQFSYHVEDRAKVTVEERDRCVGGMLGAVSLFWNETDMEELLRLTEEDVLERLETMAEEHSSENVELLVRKDGVGFECMDERGLILR